MEEWDFIDDRDLQSWKDGVQSQTEAIAAGRALEQAVQTLGAHITEGDGLGS